MWSIRRVIVVDGWFNVIQQVTATCPSIRAHWCHLANTIELVHPSAQSSPQPKRYSSSVFAQMTAECLYILQQFACFPLTIAPSYVGIWISFNMWFIGPTRVRNANGNLIVSAVFLQGSLVWHTDRATERPTDRPRYSVRCGVIMRNYAGYGKAAQSFHVSTNNFATIKSPSVRSKHLIKYLI